VSFRTWLFEATETIEVWFEPPVPTMNSRIPFCASDFPDASCGAKRS
jgi:hypothetical protein